MLENRNRPQAVIMVLGVLELDTNGRPHTVRDVPAGTPDPLRRFA
jgi:hypothetical protein